MASLNMQVADLVVLQPRNIIGGTDMDIIRFDLYSPALKLGGYRIGFGNFLGTEPLSFPGRGKG